MPERSRKTGEGKSESQRGPSRATREHQTTRSRGASARERTMKEGTTSQQRSTTGERATERRESYERGVELGRTARPVDMLELQKFLAPFDFPVPKEDLIAQARESNVDERAIAVLQGLAVAHFYSAAEVTQAVGRAA